jgi:hypothetical protein
MKTESFIRILAGVMILLSVALTQFVDVRWLWFTCFIGLNLIQSAITGFCPPTYVLGASTSAALVVTDKKFRHAPTPAFYHQPRVRGCRLQPT